MNKIIIKLIHKYDELHIPFAATVDPAQREGYSADGCLDPMLVYTYPSNDYDVVRWPDYNPEHLRGALYDAREMGLIPSECSEVELPDGKLFQIE